MAQLKNVVSIIDSEGKEVIVVNGGVYVETYTEARVGDIVKYLVGLFDVSEGGFYEVILDPEGYKSIMDEIGDVWHIREGIYKVYKAVNKQPITHTAKQTTKFKVGDDVVFVGDNVTDKGGHGQGFGKVFTIWGVDGEDKIQPYHDCDGVWYTEKDLRLATESDLKWAELGRRVGEFKDGDVVRFLENTGANGFLKGKLAVIRNLSDGYFEFGNYYDGKTTWIELMSPVESVVNLKGLDG